jgi:plasmid stability protein
MLMARTQTLVQLSDDLVALLDREAARCGLSRSALIRQILRNHLESEVAVSTAIIDGYTRVPQATPDAWGSLDALVDASTRETLQRLDEEDQRAGTEPW